MHSREEQTQAFHRLLDIMDELREKCPWDRKQTMESLYHLTIEETYELGDAILNNDLTEVKKELGDLFLHLVFYSKIGEEKNAFDVADVLNTIAEKLIFRHPHIYGDVEVKNEEEVKRNWEQLKMKEGRKSVLSGVPKGLPAMVKAMRIQEKVKGVGFDFPNGDESFAKIQEEIHELQEADEENLENEFGDILFSLINYARFLQLNPESALEKTNQKFKNRFERMEAEIQKNGLSFSDLSLEEMDAYWEKSKQKNF
ncbi:Nucleoside triphosphate pyrophosphohydrolase [Candidatus Ornithobacterium hominis]|uniref:Nucleoside triphosphate pyrophosphohydrolase n=1 Tax=Candidatus Ornithobacterium hominis TaxID=2497989 RepID=A0A383U1V5_9FLAO|nr:nucleoside triphosphate pyrophosphohydrolase [Candidatus Ornithobacterium hominis]MCT7905085.1 nucleoside triphosphate pyrophosphohydrolase [Candidatus Ornithobacterium hominis]SZD73510.1 Nucleoside triphosphate pyrophosphohydrolase [Candidatus Ornithobacterium hominis]